MGAVKILVLDVGGTHVKMRLGAGRKELCFESGESLTPARMVKEVLQLVPRGSFDALSIGYPGLVVRGRIVAEPRNLGRGWVRFDFRKAFGCPVKIVNDAAMQALGSYRGGRMLFLGLGTGLGSCLILDGEIEPMELAHLPYRKGRTYEEVIGERGLERLGKKKWRRRVAEIVKELSTALEPDYVVIGGGNARKLARLPRGARLGDNAFAFTGGLRLWKK
jgi:polyphosphate glucokinase